MGKHKVHSEKWKRFKAIVKRICGRNIKNGKFYILAPYERKI